MRGIKMDEQTDEIAVLMAEIAGVIDAAKENNLDALYDYRASIISMYAQAMVEFHFHEEQLEWLNSLLRSVENNDIKECLRQLAIPDNTDDIFLGSQFAAVMAGFFHHDELMTAAQAVGMKAILEAIASQNSPDGVN
jgi:hypothetical protein